jgi:hypothetical protein
MDFFSVADGFLASTNVHVDPTHLSEWNQRMGMER